MKPLVMVPRILAFAVIAVGVIACSDEEARAQAEQALAAVQRLEVQLKENEETLVRVHRALIASEGVTANEALDTATEALDRANQSQACCDANLEKIDRIYQKIISMEE